MERETVYLNMKCGFTGKQVFKSHEKALSRGGEILASMTNRKSKPVFFRAYQCEYCDGYHLSSSKQRVYST